MAALVERLQTDSRKLSVSRCVSLRRLNAGSACSFANQFPDGVAFPRA
jgi:hypothetical protein